MAESTSLRSLNGSGGLWSSAKPVPAAARTSTATASHRANSGPAPCMIGRGRRSLLIIVPACIYSFVASKLRGKADPIKAEARRPWRRHQAASMVSRNGWARAGLDDDGDEPRRAVAALRQGPPAGPVDRRTHRPDGAALPAHDAGPRLRSR